MIVRKANDSDKQSIVAIIEEAKKLLKSKNIDQWQNGYPNEEIIEEDIKSSKLYVIEEDNKVIATLTMSYNDEKTYDSIYEGQWQYNDYYGVCHRVAVKDGYRSKNVATSFFEKIHDIAKKEGAISMRIDTHPQNLSMQKTLNKIGYKYCGIIFVKDNDMRWAYEKLL
ncbi:MAG: GNAT family N-acetyltransferase [Cellulosilyticaceae bacterium]